MMGMKKKRSEIEAFPRSYWSLISGSGPFSEGSHKMLYFCNSCSPMRVQFPCLATSRMRLPFPLPARCPKCELFQGPTPPG